MYFFIVPRLTGQSMYDMYLRLYILIHRRRTLGRGGMGTFPWLSFSWGEAPPLRFGHPNDIKRTNWKKSMLRGGQISCPGWEGNRSGGKFLRAQAEIILPP